MFFVLCWISPGLVTAIIFLVKWYKGENITYANAKMVLALVSLGIFIPVAQDQLLTMEDSRIFIPGRKISKE